MCDDVDARNLAALIPTELVEFSQWCQQRVDATHTFGTTCNYSPDVRFEPFALCPQAARNIMLASVRLPDDPSLMLRWINARSPHGVEAYRGLNPQSTVVNVSETTRRLFASYIDFGFNVDLQQRALNDGVARCITTPGDAPKEALDAGNLTTQAVGPAESIMTRRMAREAEAARLSAVASSSSTSAAAESISSYPPPPALPAGIDLTPIPIGATACASKKAPSTKEKNSSAHPPEAVSSADTTSAQLETPTRMTRSASQRAALKETGETSLFAAASTSSTASSSSEENSSAEQSR